jgi:hypothetical protein
MGPIYVEEDQGVAAICLQLDGVNEPTQAQIWADIVSRAGTALGESISYVII